MGQAILFEALDQPVTSVLAVALVAIWAYLQQRHLGYAEVGMSYERVIVDKQFWRCGTAQLAHIEIIHLLFNISALWSIGIVERAPGLGFLYYLHNTALLLVLTPPIALLLYHAAIKYGHRDDYRTVTSVGYSGVLFGWMTIMAVKQPAGITMLPIFGLATLPTYLAPFGSLILTSLIIPRASFVGHLAGILAGYLISFGTFAWLPVWGALIVATAAMAAITANYLQQQQQHQRGGNLVGGNSELTVPFLSHFFGWGRQSGGASDVEAGGGGPRTVNGVLR